MEAVPIGVQLATSAAAGHANVGAWTLFAGSDRKIESQQPCADRLARPIGDPVDCGGLPVSGGNMANVVCFLAARAAKAGWDVCETVSLVPPGNVSASTARWKPSTWIQKAADIARDRHRVDPMDSDGRHASHGRLALRREIEGDRAGRSVPCMVVGTGGSVQGRWVDRLRRFAPLQVA